MSGVTYDPVETGLEVIDLQDDAVFARRRLHVRDVGDAGRRHASAGSRLRR